MIRCDTAYSFPNKYPRKFLAWYLDNSHKNLALNANSLIIIWSIMTIDVKINIEEEV